MVENSVHEAVWTLINTFQETSQAVTGSFAAAQERNRKIAESFFTEGMEVLKANQEAAKSLATAQERTRELAQHFFSEGLEVLKANQTAAEQLAAAQERNVQYAQRFFTDGTQILEQQAEGMRSLMQALEQQTKKQQEALQTLARTSVDTYMDFLRTPLSYYQQTLDAAQRLTWQGLENFQKASQQMYGAAQQMGKQPDS